VVFYFYFRGCTRVTLPDDAVRRGVAFGLPELAAVRDPDPLFPVTHNKASEHV